MGLVEFPSIIEVDVPEIDAQHARIFELAAAFAGGGDQVRVMKSLAILCDYVKTHFREEEMLMAASNFPGLDEHRRQHEQCRKMLYDLLGRAANMGLDDVADEVKRLIDGWIYNHILTADSEYVPYLKAARAGRR
jgi:hemerythrin